MDVEKALCYLQQAEEDAWIAVINRIGWQSNRPWVNDELEARIRYEEERVDRAKQAFDRLVKALGGQGA